jgi:predicted alpha/beta-hydrolase family hydrolase
MQRWKGYLSQLGSVHLFDYSYQAAGRGRPDPLPKMLAAHAAAVGEARRLNDPPIVLIGKSMGGRVGCHLSIQEAVPALICLGYPLCAGGDRTRLRDEVLRQLTTPVLFVQGTRDSLCPLDLLSMVRQQMKAPSEIHVVTGGDHSLSVSKGQLKMEGKTQQEIDQQILATIDRFLSPLRGHEDFRGAP